LVVEVEPLIVVTATLHDPLSQPELLVVVVTPFVEDTETLQETEALLETPAPANEVTVVPFDTLVPLVTVVPPVLGGGDSPDTVPVPARTPTRTRAANPSAAVIFIPVEPLGQVWQPQRLTA
jgi:hypothetical protein